MRKCMVIGLDGVSHSLLNNYISKGIMPHLGEIISSGYELKKMNASIPDVSSTSWASFMTGTNPAQHGIYGFIELCPGTYDIRFPNYDDIEVPTIWEVLGGDFNGRRKSGLYRYREKLPENLTSVIINLPQTYPARKMNGAMISGFVAPSLEKSVYPQILLPMLRDMEYMTDVDVEGAKKNSDLFFEKLFRSLELRGKIFHHFLEKDAGDLYIFTITETDRLHHFFYDSACNEKQVKEHSFFRRFYGAIDELLYELYLKFMELTRGDGLFMTLSDHGFAPIETEVYMNAFLKEKKLLHLSNDGDFFNKITGTTAAFALDPSRIYINLKGKYPRGTVEEGERDEVKHRIIEEIKSLAFGDERRRVIREIYDCREIYEGPLFEYAPDLVCLPEDGFDLKARINEEEIFGQSDMRGMHTRYDAHCLMPAGTSCYDPLHIEHIAHHIINYFIE